MLVLVLVLLLVLVLWLSVGSDCNMNGKKEGKGIVLYCIGVVQ